MKNFSYSGAANAASPVPVASYLYRDTGAAFLTNDKDTKHAESSARQENDHRAAQGKTTQEINELLELARVEAVAATENRLEKEYEVRLAGEAARIREALELFLVERKDYFSRVESEVVHLALSISAKILHREAQVDPLLVAGLVRVAVDKLHDGSSVSVRVSPSQTGKWAAYLANPLNGSTIAIVEDTHLGPEDCILETDLGSANFSIEAQLKEVEQGFFDLLAQRPLLK